MARRHNPNKYNPGDRVMYSRDFLKVAGMEAGTWAWDAKGEVDRIDGMLCVVKWDDGPTAAVEATSLVPEERLNGRKYR